MKTRTNFELLKARLQVTDFYYKLNEEQKKECLKALKYAGIPIKELTNEFSLNMGTAHIIYSKRETLKNIFKSVILSNTFIKVFVYTSAFILCLLLTLEI
jgi:hypothetical protein